MKIFVESSLAVLFSKNFPSTLEEKYPIKPFIMPFTDIDVLIQIT